MLLAVGLLVSVTPAHAGIYQWEYINRSDFSQKMKRSPYFQQQSLPRRSTLAFDIIGQGWRTYWTPFMSDVTQILSRIESGDSAAAEDLLPLVYDELRKLAAVKLAQEKPGQTFQATALVHEAYLRLVDGVAVQHWNSRGHFFAAAAESMRRIIVDRARDKKRIKRGGDRQRIDLDAVTVALDAPADEVLEIDESLELLRASYPDCAELVKLRFFAGLSQGEAANVLGIPRRTADRHWAFARAWLHKRLSQDRDS
jgi:RNA polymerase sigma factor (TIGR02999 family)